jgi:peptidoglycan/xylan/chitin deacetylase (PgdA/CDA1 family)
VAALNSADRADGAAARRGTVIAYHAVGPCPPSVDRENLFVSADSFARQMAYLARRRAVIPLESLVRGEVPPGRPPVAITFDDGFRSVLTAAAPILRRHGFPATVFVPTGWLGRRGRWYDAPGCEVEVMTEPELREAERLGLEIASHGHDHLDLEQATAPEAEADMAASVEALTAVVGRRPRYLAYPWGRSSAAAQQAAAAAGFDAAFSIDLPHEGMYSFARVGITRLDGPIVFALKTSGRYQALRRSLPVSGAYSLVKPLVRHLRRPR